MPPQYQQAHEPVITQDTSNVVGIFNGVSQRISNKRLSAIQSRNMADCNRRLKQLQPLIQGGQIHQATYDKIVAMASALESSNYQEANLHSSEVTKDPNQYNLNRNWLQGVKNMIKIAKQLGV